jgi:hypothetical protein
MAGVLYVSISGFGVSHFFLYWATTRFACFAVRPWRTAEAKTRTTQLLP